MQRHLTLSQYTSAILWGDKWMSLALQSLETGDRAAEWGGERVLVKRGELIPPVTQPGEANSSGVAGEALMKLKENNPHRNLIVVGPLTLKATYMLL